MIASSIALLIVTIWIWLLQHYYNTLIKDFKAEIRDINEKINILSDQQVELMEQIKEMREEHYDISRQQIKVKEIHPTDNTELHR